MADRVHDVLSMPYTRIVRAADQGGFACEVLEFSGCFATGDSAEEAMENLEEAMAMWVEAEEDAGHDIPEPLTASVEYSGRLTLRIPPSLHERAALRAQLEGISLNRLLSAAIAAYTGQDLATEFTVPASGLQALRPGTLLTREGDRVVVHPETGALHIVRKVSEADSPHYGIGAPTDWVEWHDLPEGGGVTFDTDLNRPQPPTP